MLLLQLGNRLCLERLQELRKFLAHLKREYFLRSGTNSGNSFTTVSLLVVLQVIAVEPRKQRASAGALKRCVRALLRSENLGLVDLLRQQLGVQALAEAVQQRRPSGDDQVVQEAFVEVKWLVVQALDDDVLDRKLL